MDREKLFMELADKSSSIFNDFMARAAKLEELADAGLGHLKGFHRELEMFTRVPLSKASTVFDEIIKAHYTERLKEYIEAGFRNCHSNLENISKLHSYKQVLEDHLNTAKIILGELECLKDKAINTTNPLIGHGLDLAFVSLEDPKEEESCSFQEDAEDLELLEKTMSHATLVTIIHKMLEHDFGMQEKIIKSLGMNTASSELESYCLMWELRPYIDDKVMHLAWRYVHS